MNYLAPLTLLAALISTALFFTPVTVRADQADINPTTQEATQTTMALPFLSNSTQATSKLPAVNAPLKRPDEQVVNDNLAFSYEYRPQFQTISKPGKGTEIEFITLPHINFGHNGSQLSSRATDILNGAAQFVFENDTTIKRILINGHTSNIADMNYNLRLSDARAYTVLDYLAGMGVPPEMMVVNGWGETRPIDENWTRAGRQRNRHIEIQIVRITKD